MKKLILTAALGPIALMLSGCGDTEADTEEADTAVVETTPKVWHYNPEVGMVTSIAHDHIDL